MIQKCLNPDCVATLERLGKGEIYAVERRHPQRGHGTEFYWMCSSCLPHIGIAVDASGTIGVKERQGGPYLPPPRVDCDVRVAFQVTPGSILARPATAA